MRLAGHTVEFGARTWIMGVINVTPDSFSGDGLSLDVEAAVAQAVRFAAEGADLLDVGGESTRPGADTIGGGVEIQRVVPVIEAIRREVDLPVSIDTRHAEVALAALAAGADLVNDVTGLTFDPMMAKVVADAGVPLVLQHIRGTPQTMQGFAHYQDVVADVATELRHQIDAAVAAGIDPERIIVDPGLGFGKTAQHNLALIRRLEELQALGRPILIGPSRKSFIGRILGVAVAERVEGTAAAVALSIAHGADIVRVHDVKAMVRVAKMADAIVRGWDEPTGD